MNEQSPPPFNRPDAPPPPPPPRHSACPTCNEWDARSLYRNNHRLQTKNRSCARACTEERGGKPGWCGRAGKRKLMTITEAREMMSATVQEGYRQVREIHPTYRSLSSPFNTDCLPLSYSGNPGVIRHFEQGIGRIPPLRYCL